VAPREVSAEVVAGPENRRPVRRCIRTLTALHAALGEPGRLAVVDTQMWGEASPGELATRLGMTTNLLAHHLNVLEASVSWPGTAPRATGAAATSR
jgi:hypothetical protein